MKEVEISQIDTRFEGCRLRDKNQEKVILSSILEQGIREPLQCVVKPGAQLILLDGFKRLRCAVKLRIKVVPVVSLGSDEAGGILQLIRLGNAPGLSILEQAALVDELKGAYGMSSGEIARHLERSPAWVSVRLGIMGDMSAVVKEAVFSGRFPVRSYMYTLRQFTRVKGVKKSEVDTFVSSVSGKGLSIRALELLAHGFFKGGQNLREQIRQGNLDWTLHQLKQEAMSNSDSLSEWEAKTLRDLDLAQSCIGRIPYELKDSRLKSPSFFATADLLAGNILGKMNFFLKALEEFYDQGREKKSSENPLWGGQEEERDCPASRSGAQDSTENTGGELLRESA